MSFLKLHPSIRSHPLWSKLAWRIGCIQFFNFPGLWFLPQQAVWTQFFIFVNCGSSGELQASREMEKMIRTWCTWPQVAPQQTCWIRKAQIWVSDNQKVTGLGGSEGTVLTKDQWTHLWTQKQLWFDLCPLKVLPFTLDAIKASLWCTCVFDYASLSYCKVPYFIHLI